MVVSGGYPEEYQTEKIIEGLDDLDDDILVFHSATKLLDGEIVTNGGRVLGIASIASTIENASEKVYRNIEKIRFENMHYRTDIGTNLSCELV